MLLNLRDIPLQINRSFSWITLWILATLWLFGNIASIPLLQYTNRAIDSLDIMIATTAASVAIIAFSLFIARQVGLGCVFFERLLIEGEYSVWLRKVLSISLIFSIINIPIILLFNQNTAPELAKAYGKIILASADAGIQEELFYRFFLMTLFVWLGGLLRRGTDNRSEKSVVWSAILLSGIIFGWAHMDDYLGDPLISSSIVFAKGIWSAFLGVVFGWLYWKLGLESAILTHFLVDAVGSLTALVYLSDNFLLHFAALICLILFATISGIMFKSTIMTKKTGI